MVGALKVNKLTGLAALVTAGFIGLCSAKESVETTVKPQKEDNPPAVQNETPKTDNGLVEKIKMLKDMMSIDKTLTRFHYAVDFITKEGVEKSKKIYEANGKNTTYDINGINLNGDSIKHITPLVGNGANPMGVSYVVHTALKWNSKKGHIKYAISSEELPGESYEIHIEHEEKENGSINDITYTIIKDENGKEEKSKIVSLHPEAQKDKNEKNPTNSLYLAIVFGIGGKNNIYSNLKTNLRSETDEPKPVVSLPKHILNEVGGQVFTITAEGASIACIGVDK